MFSEFELLLLDIIVVSIVITVWARLIYLSCVVKPRMEQIEAELISIDVDFLSRGLLDLKKNIVYKYSYHGSNHQGHTVSLMHATVPWGIYPSKEQLRKLKIESKKNDGNIKIFIDTKKPSRSICTFEIDRFNKLQIAALCLISLFLLPIIIYWV